MSKLQQIEREIEQHIQRPNHCGSCLKSITDVTAPACDVLVELNRQAQEVSERRERYAAYKAHGTITVVDDDVVRAFYARNTSSR